MKNKEIKTNVDTEKLLNDENKKYITDILCYLKTKNIDSAQMEIIHTDILSMILDAQQRGDSIEMVLGGDFKTFCDEILSCSKYKKKRNIICEWSDCILSALLVLVGISFLFSDDFVKFLNNLIHRTSSDWFWNITSGNLFTWVVLLAAVFIFLSITTQTSLSQKNKHSRTNSFIFNAVLMAVCLILAYITKSFFNQVVFHLHLRTFLIIFFDGYICHKILNKFS